MRLSILVLLIVTTILLKGQVLSQVSIPAVNLTILDVYCNNTIACLVLNVFIMALGSSDMSGMIAYLLIVVAPIDSP